MIERAHLKILVEIERQGSLTAAAKALYLTQSALSHTIKKLEGQLGAPLWHKEGRAIQFTQAGLYLLDEAHRILPQLERADEVLKQYAKGEKGTVRIGMECFPCYQWLLGAVEPFLKKWPDVGVDVKQRFQFGGVPALLNREIDLLVTPDPVDKKGLVFEPVFDYEQVLLVSRSNLLAQKETIRPRDLIDQVLYTYPVPMERLDIFKDFLLPEKVMPMRHIPIEATEIMVHMVAADRGVVALPKWLCKIYEKDFDIKTIRLGEEGVHKSIHIGMREGALENSLERAFMDVAAEQG